MKRRAVIATIAVAGASAGCVVEEDSTESGAGIQEGTAATNTETAEDSTDQDDPEYAHARQYIVDELELFAEQVEDTKRSETATEYQHIVRDVTDEDVLDEFATVVDSGLTGQVLFDTVAEIITRNGLDGSDGDTDGIPEFSDERREQAREYVLDELETFTEQTDDETSAERAAEFVSVIGETDDGRSLDAMVTIKKNQVTGLALFERITEIVAKHGLTREENSEEETTYTQPEREQAREYVLNQLETFIGRVDDEGREETAKRYQEIFAETTRSDVLDALVVLKRTGHTGETLFERVTEIVARYDLTD